MQKIGRIHDVKFGEINETIVELNRFAEQKWAARRKVIDLASGDAHKARKVRDQMIRFDVDMRIASSEAEKGDLFRSFLGYEYLMLKLARRKGTSGEFDFIALQPRRPVGKQVHRRGRIGDHEQFMREIVKKVYLDRDRYGETSHEMFPHLNSHLENIDCHPEMKKDRGRDYIEYDREYKIKLKDGRADYETRRVRITSARFANLVSEFRNSR